MQGIILDNDKSTNKGIIRGDDGLRYGFYKSSLKSADSIKAGLKVDFEISDNTATDIYIVKTNSCTTNIIIQPRL